MSDILERLRVKPTVTLPQAESLIPVAAAIRQMMVERAEAAAEITALRSRCDGLERALLEVKRGAECRDMVADALRSSTSEEGSTHGQ